MKEHETEQLTQRLEDAERDQKDLFLILFQVNFVAVIKYDKEFGK